MGSRRFRAGRCRTIIGRQYNERAFAGPLAGGKCWSAAAARRSFRRMMMSDPQQREPHVVLVVSDGTGVTGERVIKAAITQFEAGAVVTERIAGVRDRSQLVAAVEDAARRRATLLFSLVSPVHRRALLHEARRRHVVTVDLLGPILRRLSDVLASSPRAVPGLLHALDEEYFRRIDAIEFALQHDDGHKSEELGQADLVLVGVSRTSKTPLSMFLAHRGWRIANVPIVLGVEPPAEVFRLPRSKVIALIARPSWLEGLRRERMRRMARGYDLPYAESEHIHQELAWSEGIIRRAGWQIVDVTRKALEESAAEVVALLPDETE
ncbi:MAG: pyruvate, phosphate dikinase/phosphoenolpyruvate synthase regulator [Candidatus Eisenbacteria bacterium]|nr:pyruvate, phosphate dikinase/phosphoenolpyruvate synthase regulator [Candidatus Eisenbacteria bacterium]